MNPLRPKPSAILAALLLSTIPAALAAPGNGNGPSGGNGPSSEAVQVQLNLTGVATRTSGGPDAGFVAFVNVTGEGVRRTPNGNGVQVRADNLLAEVTIVRSSDNETVAQFDALVDFHAQQASSIARGLEPGNFKFNLGLRGAREAGVLGSETDSRILAFSANGDTFGASDDDGAHSVAGRGRTTLKDAGSNAASHYNIQLGCTGSILAA